MTWGSLGELTGDTPVTMMFLPLISPEKALAASPAVVLLSKGMADAV